MVVGTGPWRPVPIPGERARPSAQTTGESPACAGNPRLLPVEPERRIRPVTPEVAVRVPSLALN